MTHYIAFLRAINVGGRTVKMDELKKHFAMPGFKNVATYIQSGNVIFDHADSDVAAIAAKVEAKLLKTLGYEVKTFIRMIPELETIVNNCPFKNVAEDMGLHVSFLSAKPDAAAVKELMAFQNEQEHFAVGDREAYILVKKGAYGETKFSNTFLEKKLKVAATTRNWATVNKMMGM